MASSQRADDIESGSTPTGAVEFSWRAEVWPGASLGVLSSILTDLGTLVAVGERWALIAARHEAKSWVARHLRAAGPRGLLNAAGELDLEIPLPEDARWYLDRGKGYWFPGEEPPLRWQFENFASGIIDARLARTIPEPVRVLEVIYQNPFWSLFRASAESVPWIIKVLKLYQTWDSGKRKDAAEASKAEAEAEAETAKANAAAANADARIRNAQADVSEAAAEALVKLTKAWKGNPTEPPPFELLQVLTAGDHAAGQRISKLRYEIEGPLTEALGEDPGSPDRNEAPGTS